MERGTRLPALTGLRWAAALAVFGQHTLELFLDEHLAAPHLVRTILWGLFAHAGAIGVSFFFVLSGFVLTWAGFRRPYFRRRLLRIYPAVFVTTIAAVFITGQSDPAVLAAHLFLMQAWIPDHGVYAGLNPVSWSLSCEAFFYLCFPLLLPLASRLRTAGLWLLSAGLVGFVGLFAAASTVLDRETALWAAYLLPPVRLAEFVLGIAVAALVRQGAWRGPNLTVSAGLVAAAALVALQLPYPLSEHTVTLVPVTCVVAAAARGDAAGVLSRPLWQYLGELSYAFYLVHYLVWLTFARLGLIPERAGLLVAALTVTSVFAFSVLAAMAVHHGVERPFLRLQPTAPSIRSRSRSA